MPFIKVAAKHVSTNRRVLGKVNHAKRRVLFKVGGLIRRIAERKIKPVGKYGKPSKPPSPPKSRLGFLRKSMRFKVLDDDASVIIGPIRRNTRNNAARINEVSGYIMAPSKRVPIPERAVRKDVKWEAGQEPFPSKRYPSHMMVLLPRRREYPEREFMGPSLDKGSEKYPQMFKDTVRK